MSADLVFYGEVDKIGINQNLIWGTKLTVVLEKQSSRGFLSTYNHTYASKWVATATSQGRMCRTKKQTHICRTAPSCFLLSSGFFFNLHMGQGQRMICLDTWSIAVSKTRT